MDEIKPGDIVILKSDSQSAHPVLMTVAWINTEETCCIWRVSGQWEFKSERFPIEVLQKRR